MSSGVKFDRPNVVRFRCLACNTVVKNSKGQDYWNRDELVALRAQVDGYRCCVGCRRDIQLPSASDVFGEL